MSSRIWGEIGLLSVIWASSFLFMKVAVVDVQPLLVVFYRVLIGGAFLVGYVYLRGCALPRDFATWRNLLILGLLNNAIPFSLITVAVQSITGGLASVLNAATGIFGVLFAAVFFADERFRAHRMIGVVIGVIGVSVTVGVEPSQLAGSWVPKLMVVAAAVSYALASMWAKARLSHLSLDATAAGQLIGASLWMLPAALFLQPFSVFSAPAEAIGSVLGLAIICSAWAYPLYFSIIRRAGAGVATLVTITIPPAAILMTSIFLAETLYLHEMVGFLIIAGALIIIDGRWRKSEQRK